MAKGCLVIVGAVIFTVLVFILGASFFSAEPATSEIILAVLDENLKDEESISTYIELIDYLNKHKAEVTNSLSEKSDCVEFNLSMNGRHLSKEITIYCEKVLSRAKNIKTLSVVVCKNQSITLKVFQQDYENYLYITRLFFINDTLQKNFIHDTDRGRLIKGKYSYFVRIEDAFNQIDPNNFAPN